MYHIILAIPVLALALFFFLPFRVALSIYLPVTAASGFVYFKLIAAMRSKVQTGLEQMIGEEAVVIEDIDPEGKVEIGDEIWKATANGKKFHKGERVEIDRAQGLTLVVKDLDEKKNTAQSHSNKGGNR
jgi:membrane protein implicated in regulation of membrane protease activity